MMKTTADSVAQKGRKVKMEQVKKQDIEFDPFYAENIQEGDASRFVIDDDRKADWAVRRIAEIQQETKAWKDYYKAQSDKMVQDAESRIAYFTAMLGDYFATVPHKATKTQESYKLPSGKLVLKNRADDYERDDEQIIAWCAANAPEYVQNVPKLKWSELKKQIAPDGEEMVLAETGEVVPGIKRIERDREFTVSPD